MPGPEARRLATCSANTFSQNRLPFGIQSPMVLVLDAKSLEEGQIIGVLQEGDLIGASLVEHPWVMLPENSFVRHPKMRQGRIKLLRPGWVMSQHPQYGDLLHAVSMDQVRKLFAEEAFAKLPMVKEAAQTNNKPVEGGGEPQGYPGSRAPAEPKATPAPSQPKAPPAPAASAQPKAPQLPTAASPPAAQPKAATPSQPKAVAPKPSMPAPAPEAASAGRSAASARQGRSEAALVSGVPRRPWSAAPPPEIAVVSAPSSPLVKAASSPTSPSPQSPSPKAAGGESIARGSQTLAKMPKQTRAAPELCQRHLQMCNCEHWKVIHTFVFVRSEASLQSEPLAVLREGSLLCAARPEEPRSLDGKWARLGSQAKVWPEITSEKPDFVALGRQEDVQRHLAREASNKLFGGSQSPRVSRVALAQSVRSGTPLSTSHDAPEALGREDTLERAHREMLMGNGPRPDLESTRPEAPPVATHSTSSSPSRTVQGSTSSPSRPRGAAAAASPGGSPFFVEPNQDSSTTTVSTKRQEDEAQREEPEVQHSSQPRNAREPSSPTRLPKEILRKRKGPSLRSSRNSSFVMRHQRSSVSEMSEDEAMSPASGALPAALASGPGLTKLIEDTVADYVRSKDFISFINQQCDLPFVHQCIQRLSEMVPDLQAQQSEMQKELHQVDEDLQSSKATLHRSLELRATEETTAQLAKRVTKNEKFSEQGIDAILQSVEGRVLEFLSEGEAERARLWHQMSVLFPRFIQEGNEKKPMSVSEARAYALDVRLDSLEDFVVRRSGTPRRSRSFPAAAGRNLADVAEVTDGALVEDGHEEAEAADEDVGRSSGSRSFGFERFSFAPEAFKATPGSHLHEILERLKEQLASGAPSQAAAELLAEDAVHVGTASAPPSLLRRSKLENHTKSLSVTFEEPNQLKEAATGAATERMEVSPSPRPSGFQGLSEGGGSRSGEKPDPPEVDCFIYEPPEAPPQLVQVDSPRSLAVTSGQLAQAEGDVRTVDEALSDVLEGSRTQDLGEVQLIRALNPRSPNMWLIGDAAAGRVIGRRSEEVPSRRRTRTERVPQAPSPNTSR